MREFNRTTGIKSMKRVAKDLLYYPVVADDLTGLLVYHPFFTTIHTMVRVDGKNIVADITTADGLKLARQYYEGLIDRVEKCNDFFKLFRTPYLPLFFKKSLNYFSRKDYSEFLAEMWVRVEYPNNCPYFSIMSFAGAFANADKKIIMDNKERRVLKKLPEEVVVYRGVKPDAQIKALSWTLSYDTAKWFADRFEENGTVYRARIKKEDILAYFGSRGESEVVVKPTKLHRIERITNYGSLADRLKFYRKNIGLTQQKLAEKTGIGRDSIARYETGDRNPTAENLQLLADALEVSLETLIQ